MTFIAPDTARTLRIPAEAFDELLDRIARKIDRGNRLVHPLRAEWYLDPHEDPSVSFVVTLDLVEARHLQQHFGEQDGEALKRISAVFGVPPRNWNAYGGTPPGAVGLGASHSAEHTTY